MDLSIGMSWMRGEVYGREKVQKYFREFEKTEKLFSSYNKTIDNKAFNFIKNETQSYLYSGFFQFLTSNYNWLFTDIQDTSGRSIVSATYNPAYNEFTDIRDKIEHQNIHDIYNDYGLYSRKMVESYYRYEFNKTNKIYNDIQAGFGVNYARDIESRIEFMRLILTGSPLYRELASVLSSVLVKNDRIYFYISRDEYNTKTALEKIDLFTKICNNVELSAELKEVAHQYQKLSTDNYFPQLNFLDFNGKKTTYDDFAGEKPTVFCISEGWGNSRYQFDDFAKDNPDINFVMVCENTSFETWKDYTKRAEPIAKHLLYVNDTKSVRDIFQKPYVYFVLDKNGEFVEYVSETKSGIRVARESLEPKKKELNKSQLIIIIWVLGILILIALVVFAIWKWRVRQRFRKEAQIRKLRELELTAIRSQMNPHFLFNCLNSVQNLVQQNKGREAHLYLSDFAGLIRKVLQNSEKEEVSLAEELEMTEQYLNLEKLRFDFDFQIQVERGIDINNTMVPSMLLQPFTENAVIHGLQNKTENRKLKIEVKRNSHLSSVIGKEENPGIVISIEDNGIGREAAKEIAKVKNGKGSKLIQERLEILQEKQGEKYRLEIIDLNESCETGTRVEIFIPEEK